ncbi:MAG TPA: Stp1/IreP family PP2C-type Ser/Thr phosphatase [Firmicutes bacterium]|nr:Stp1/IreP family PP2C-type Ser/Thr phosphatase [Bacillota bacterium]
MTIFGMTDIGRVRENNQDAFACGEIRDGGYAVVVCDGMGGYNGGNVASQMACDIIFEKLKADYHGKMEDMTVKNLLLSAVHLGNLKVYEHAQEHTDLAGMGTTVIAAIADAEAIHLVHVGDSRAYLYTPPGTVQQLTRDHSLVQTLIEQGKIAEDERKTHPHRNYITRAVGIEEEVEVDYTYIPFLPGERLLCCTDGLTNFTDPERIGSILSKLDDRQACMQLIEHANAAGGYDNITVVLLSNQGN